MMSSWHLQSICVGTPSRKSSVFVHEVGQSGPLLLLLFDGSIGVNKKDKEQHTCELSFFSYFFHLCPMAPQDVLLPRSSWDQTTPPPWPHQNRGFQVASFFFSFSVRSGVPSLAQDPVGQVLAPGAIKTSWKVNITNQHVHVKLICCTNVAVITIMPQAYSPRTFQKRLLSWLPCLTWRSSDQEEQILNGFEIYCSKTHHDSPGIPYTCELIWILLYFVAIHPCWSYIVFSHPKRNHQLVFVPSVPVGHRRLSHRWSPTNLRCSASPRSGQTGWDWQPLGRILYAI